MKATNRRIAIDEEKCRGCGTCAKLSGGGEICIENGKARVYGKNGIANPEKLIDGCPECAISLAELEKAVAAGMIPEETLVRFQVYLFKMKGVSVSPPRVNTSEIIWSWIGAFLGIAVVGYMNFNLIGETDMIMLIGSFGASAVLIYGAISSPLAQPRNLVGGHVISAFIGVACYQLFHEQLWIASSLAVATAIAVMHFTKTLHPPGGATALIAVIGSSKVHALGYLYALVPVGTGALLMLVIALLVNNIPSNRRYPEFWL